MEKSSAVFIWCQLNRQRTGSSKDKNASLDVRSLAFAAVILHIACSNHTTSSSFLLVFVANPQRSGRVAAMVYAKLAGETASGCPFSVCACLAGFPIRALIEAVGRSGMSAPAGVSERLQCAHLGLLGKDR